MENIEKEERQNGISNNLRPLEREFLF
jgi:hypothetical protein